MSNNDIESMKTKKAAKKLKVGVSKPYSKPQLEMLGDLRNLTLGGSPGVLDSSGSQVTQSVVITGVKMKGLLPAGGNRPGGIPTPDNPFLP